MPGQLTPITDQNELERIWQQTGIRPYADEKADWIAQESIRCLNAHIPFDSDELAAKYDRLKQAGNL